MTGKGTICKQAYLCMQQTKESKRNSEDRPEIKERIVNSITEAADGMFQLAKLHVGSIQSTYNEEDLDEALTLIIAKKGHNTAFRGLESRRYIYPLLRYAVRNWGEYALLVESEPWSEILKYPRKPGLLASAFVELRAKYSFTGTRAGTRRSPMEEVMWLRDFRMTALFVFSSIVQLPLDANINYCDGRKRTAFHFTLILEIPRNLHVTASILLEKRIDPSRRDLLGRMAVFYATQDPELMKLLDIPFSRYLSQK
ncbi:hypothetical protein B0J11DRAFT_501049 [Dendryphion nanum]|uniref:Uncharacterized protein n=1 Tax=Dendryphion nanum TaxID=256645 RepID=A0A9P9IX29_9PLEO|nr:hypothetical protein B0J11DRAFT_501049 [Dendryphion nanum]